MWISDEAIADEARFLAVPADKCEAASDTGHDRGNINEDFESPGV